MADTVDLDWSARRELAGRRATHALTGDDLVAVARLVCTDSACAPHGCIHPESCSGLRALREVAAQPTTTEATP